MKMSDYNTKPFLYAGLVCLLIGSVSGVYADESHHASDGAAQKASSEATTKMDGMGMTMMQRDGMRQHMEKMHALMEQAKQSKNPKERRRLMREHMQEMHQAMGMMHGMMGGKNGQMAGMSMDARMGSMEKRMDMMQQMMEQMMERQSMMEMER